jgi:predicted transcriptional regulator
MTLTLEISPEIEAQIERAAAQSQTDVSSFIVEAAVEKAANTYQTQIEKVPAYLSAIESLRTDLKGFSGGNGGELVNAGREARAAQIYGD